MALVARVMMMMMKMGVVPMMILPDGAAAEEEEEEEAEAEGTVNDRALLPPPRNAKPHASPPSRWLRGRI